MGALKTYLFCRLILEHCVQFVTLPYIQCFVKSLILDANHGRIPSGHRSRLASACEMKLNAFRSLNASRLLVLMGRVNQHHQSFVHQISPPALISKATTTLLLFLSKGPNRFGILTRRSFSWHPLLPAKFDTRKSPMTWPVLLEPTGHDVLSH
ncbi:hypothetical protein MPTK1_1g01770 [Marchantia polymorpha subsp. ruderalis]|uniref:Uncharacterized protein n=1 Tax=Marchantia polymorpha subsp. ruderalis TaxID=1480154 RepID=A0AAF6AKH3_MARPO|nr:hypothetical protein Mp_1g01770 [Marchantia polymorpha subsp. ruderalis]